MAHCLSLLGPWTDTRMGPEIDLLIGSRESANPRTVLFSFGSFESSHLPLVECGLMLTTVIGTLVDRFLVYV